MKTRQSLALSCVVFLGLALSGCGEEECPRLPGSEDPAVKLSSLGLFSDLQSHTPADGVVPYEVVAPLFSDHALKERLVRVPSGAKIPYQPTGRWSLPPGTTLVKTFSFPIDARDPALGLKRIETRLLIQTEAGLKGYVYLWDDDQQDATCKSGGGAREISWIDADGAERKQEYVVPNTGHCEFCHGGAEGKMESLGLRTRQLNHSVRINGEALNQLEVLVARGVVETPSDSAQEREALANPSGDGPLEDRARAYLEANCAHCHAASGSANELGLDLSFDNTERETLGICRTPRSDNNPSGTPYVIAPGSEEDSALLVRVRTSDARLRMPRPTSRVIDPHGVALISEWVRSLSESCSP